MLASSNEQDKFWLPRDGTNYGMYSAVNPVSFNVMGALRIEVQLRKHHSITIDAASL